MSLKKKTVDGLIWSSVDTIGLNLVRLLITVVLARLLQPSDFGLLAMLNIFIALSDNIVDGGFSTALIRKPDARDKDYSTVFIFNFLASLLLYLIIFIASPYIADFFDQPLLNPLAKVISLVIVFHSMGIVQKVILKRNIDFKSLAIINITTTLISGIFGIVMAYFGFGVWSLAAQLVSKAFLTSVMLWILGNWELKIQFCKDSFIENFKFGYNVSLSNCIGSVIPNLYNLIIGKLYSVTSLGYYYQADRLTNLSHSFISTVFKSVSFPVLSSLQNDIPRLKSAYLKFLKMVSFITFPLMILLIIIAHPLISLTLTDKWLAIIPFFQILCLKAMLIPLTGISGNIPLVMGRSDIYLKFSILNYILMILALIITSWIGIKAMIVGLVIQSVIQLSINIWFVSRLINLSVTSQLISMTYILLISLAISVPTYFVSFLIENKVLLLIVQLFIFSILYVVIQYLVGSKELIEFKDVLKEKLLMKVPFLNINEE